MDEAKKTLAGETARANGAYNDDEVNRREHNIANNGKEQAGSSAEQLFSDSINFLKQLRSNGPWV
jgi:hypothetical protein